MKWNLEEDRHDEHEDEGEEDFAADVFSRPEALDGAGEPEDEVLHALEEGLGDTEEDARAEEEVSRDGMHMVVVCVGVEGVGVGDILVGFDLGEIGEAWGNLLLFFGVYDVVVVVGDATASGGGASGDPWAGVGGGRGGAAGRHAGAANGMPKRRRTGDGKLMFFLGVVLCGVADSGEWMMMDE